MSNHLTAIPKTLEGLLQSFTSCFTKPGSRNFEAMIVGWIVCQTRHSISRVIQASGVVEAGGKHHSRFYRFLSSGRWAIDSLGHVLFQLLTRLFSEEITLIIDDTLCHKNGPHLFGGAMHYDSHQSTYGRGSAKGQKSFFAFGHNWVVAALWLPYPWNPVRGIAVPFVFRLYRSKKYCPTRDYRKRTDLALDLVKLIASWLPEDRELHLVADSEYACKTIVRNLPDRVAFTGPMCMDAALYDQPQPHKGRGRPAKRGERLPSPRKLAASKSIPWTKKTLRIYGKTVTTLVKSIDCLWYTVAGTHRVRMVVTRDPSGRLNDRAYFTTNGEVTVENILVQFARRWEIEVAFRNTKQSLGIQNPQNGWWRRAKGEPRPKKRPGPNPRARIGEDAINHTLAVAFATHAIIVLWYWRHGNPEQDVAAARAAAPWYRKKIDVSFSDMLAALRREIWAERFSLNPLIKGGRQKIRNLLPHWLLAA